MSTSRGIRADYAALLTGPRYAWWRPLWSLLIFVFLVATGIAVLITLSLPISVALGQSPLWAVASIGTQRPAGLLLNNLSLAVCIPAAILATRWAYRVRGGLVHSVAGRFRWRWFALVLTCQLPVVVLMVAIPVALGFPGIRPEPTWLPLLLICLLTTPLQAAGEEYAFRGWMVQNLGSWFHRRWLAWTVSVLVSSAIFARLHGSTDPWTLLSLLIFAVTTAVLTWRTGGLEAAIALHVLNNVLAIGATVLTGRYGAGFVGAATRSTPADCAFALVTHAATVGVVFWAAKRWPIAKSLE